MISQENLSLTRSFWSRCNMNASWMNRLLCRSVYIVLWYHSLSFALTIWTFGLLLYWETNYAHTKMTIQSSIAAFQPQGTSFHYFIVWVFSFSLLKQLSIELCFFGMCTVYIFTDMIWATEEVQRHIYSPMAFKGHSVCILSHFLQSAPKGPKCL